MLTLIPAGDADADINNRTSSSKLLSLGNRFTRLPESHHQRTSPLMAGVVQEKALDGTVEAIMKQPALESDGELLLNRPASENVAHLKTASNTSITQPGHILTGKQEHCMQAPSLVTSCRTG